MINPFRAKPKKLEVWEYEPYAFTPGIPYVIEVDLSQIEVPELAKLDKYFQSHGVNVKLVPTKNGSALKPLSVRRMTREAEYE